MNRRLSNDKKPPRAGGRVRDKKPTVEDVLKRAVEDMAVGQRREKSPGLVLNAGKSSDDLMTSMLRRVGVLERQAEAYKKELREKIVRINDLESQVSILKRLAEPEELVLCEELKV